MTIKKDAALEKFLSRQVAEIRLIAGEQIPIRQLAGVLRRTISMVDDARNRLPALFPDVIEAAGEQKDGDAELLNGPQLPGLASSQDDVDALFDAI